MYVRVFFGIFSVERITHKGDTDFRNLDEYKIIIDKSRFISKLLKPGPRQFIMLRPYRFGKSFFLTTLAAFFEGRRDSFCSPNPLRRKMDVCDSENYTWEKYQILFRNFASLTGGKSALSEYIIADVLTLARQYGVSDDIDEKSSLRKIIQNTFTKIKFKTKKRV